MSARPPGPADRAELVRTAHVAARDLGLDEATRRELQAKVTGRGSCGDMTRGELAALVEHYRGLGWRPRRAGGGGGPRRRRDRLPAGAAAGKLRALWISGWCLGAVRDRSEGALLAFVRRAAGLDAARFADDARLGRAVEALKLWLARPAAEGGGGVDWSPYETLQGVVDRPRARVIEAQWRRLRDLGAVPSGLPNISMGHVALGGAVRIAGHVALDGAVLGDPVHLGDADADALIRALGARIRNAARAGRNHRAIGDGHG